MHSSESNLESKFNTAHPRMIRLRNQPRRYSYFQALRDIESVADGLPRLGHAHSPSQEAVRLSQSPHLDFAPTAVESARKREGGGLFLEQRCFGMLGPSGALPLHLTELVRNRLRHADDPALQAFLDLFHHRMSLLFYRAWSSARPAVQRDRPWQDRYSVYMASLAGFGLKSAQNRDRWPDETKWYFTGRMAPLRRNGEGLQAILCQMLQADVLVVPFRLRRLALQSSDRTSLGRNSHRLASEAVLGASIADRQSLFEVRVGPLKYASFARLLPGQPRRRAVEDVVRNYAGLVLDARLRLVLAKDEIPKASLGRCGSLGRNAWVMSKPAVTDADDCCLMLGFNGAKS